MVPYGRNGIFNMDISAFSAEGPSAYRAISPLVHYSCASSTVWEDLYCYLPAETALPHGRVAPALTLFAMLAVPDGGDGGRR